MKKLINCICIILFIFLVLLGVKNSLLRQQIESYTVQIEELQNNVTVLSEEKLELENVISTQEETITSLNDEITVLKKK